MHSPLRGIPHTNRLQLSTSHSVLPNIVKLLSLSFSTHDSSEDSCEVTSELWRHQRPYPEAPRSHWRRASSFSIGSKPGSLGLVPECQRRCPAVSIFATTLAEPECTLGTLPHKVVLQDQP